MSWLIFGRHNVLIIDLVNLFLIFLIVDGENLWFTEDDKMIEYFREYFGIKKEKSDG